MIRTCSAGRGQGEQRPGADPLVVDALVLLGQLDDPVQDEDPAEPVGLEDHQLLEAGSVSGTMTFATSKP